MSASEKKLVFSITRPDLLFNYARTFEEIFKFSIDGENSLSPEPNIRLQESLGFDFQNELRPIVRIDPVGEIIRSELGDEPSNYCVHGCIEDIALATRETIIEQPAEDITAPIDISLDLRQYTNLGFYRGFTVMMYITRKEDAQSKEQMIWSKSQIVFRTEFTCKASVEEALFEISWTNFKDEAEKKNSLIFVDWTSPEVSSVPHSECFQVKANNDLKPQFKRLENNSHFGDMMIRLIVVDIVKDLVQRTLRFADLSSSPVEESLHDKIAGFLHKAGLDFDELAGRYQQGDAQDQVRILSDIAKKMQVSFKVGENLNGIKFGGYRRL